MCLNSKDKIFRQSDSFKFEITGHDFSKKNLIERSVQTKNLVHDSFHVFPILMGRMFVFF